MWTTKKATEEEGTGGSRLAVGLRPYIGAVLPSCQLAVGLTAA
jgi:hypothetical protein